MALNDLHFTTEHRAPWLAGVFFVAAIALVAIGIGNDGPMMLAILAAAIAVALWATSPAEAEGSITDEGIVLTRPGAVIPFASIRWFVADIDPDTPPPPSFKIRVDYDRGVLRIVDAPGVNSAGIYQALCERYSPSGSRSVDPLLSDYLLENELEFGPDRVWSYRASLPDRDAHRPRRAPAIYLAMILTGVAWLVLKAGAQGKTAWPGLGILLILFGLLALFFGKFGGRRAQLKRIKGWEKSSLVISPVGLAMVQGDVSGEMAWDQLRNVRLKARHNRLNFQVVGDATGGLRGIVLTVEGAVILVADLYDRPIEMIHDRILRYWKPERLQTPVEL